MFPIKIVCRKRNILTQLPLFNSASRLFYFALLDIADVRFFPVPKATSILSYPRMLLGGQLVLHIFPQPFRSNIIPEKIYRKCFVDTQTRPTSSIQKCRLTVSLTAEDRLEIPSLKFRKSELT